jgi:hypothetical protein
VNVARGVESCATTKNSCLPKIQRAPSHVNNQKSVRPQKKEHTLRSSENFLTSFCVTFS